MSADRPDGPPLGDRLGRGLRRLRDGTARRSDDPLGDALALLAVVVAGAWIYYRRLGSYGLQTWDEGNYAVVARLVLDGHVLFLRHYSFADGVHAVAYLEKPPLALWIEALSMAVFGETPFGARFPSATFTLGIAVLAYLWGRRWAGRRTGLLAAVVFLTTPHVYAGNDMGRTGGVDTAFVFFGALFVLLGWRLVVGNGSSTADRSPGLRRFLPFYLAGVATVLVKGFAAATFLFVLAPLLLLHARTFLRRESVAAAAVASAVGLAWPLAAYLVAGDRFVREFVVEQVLARATGEMGISYAGATFSFMRYPYFVRLPTFLDPWFYFLLPAAVALPLVAAWRWRSGESSAGTSVGPALATDPGSDLETAPDPETTSDLETTLLLVWWAALVPVLFAVTRGNHPWYLLPMYVPAALLVGRLLADASHGRPAATLGALVGVAGFLVFSYRIPNWSPIAVQEAGGLHGTVPEGEVVLLAVVLGVAALLAVGGVERLDSEGTDGDRTDGNATVPGGDGGGGSGSGSDSGSDGSDIRWWGPSARIVAVVALLLFVTATAAAPQLTGRGWDVHQREMADAVDDAAPPDATVSMTRRATADVVYHAFAFRVDRPLETATVAELDRGEGVDYAVVAAGQVDDLSRPHERLYATTTPAGTDVVLLRIGGG